MSHDGINWRAHALVEKFDADATAWAKARLGFDPTAQDFMDLGILPQESIEAPNNLLTTAGLTRITSLLIAGGTQALTNTSCRLGVGDGSSTAAISDTDLSAASGSTHRYFNVMDSTYPSVSGGVITFKSTFASADGNFAWNEWGVDIGAPTVSAGTTVNACLLNHKSGAALGTKASGSSWAFTATITLS